MTDKWDLGVVASKYKRMCTHFPVSHCRDGELRGMLKTSLCKTLWLFHVSETATSVSQHPPQVFSPFVQGGRAANKCTHAAVVPSELSSQTGEYLKGLMEYSQLKQLLPTKLGGSPTLNSI